jgi:MFS family permease
MSRHQRIVVALCVTLAVTDGLDAQLLAYAAPHIAKEIGFSPASLGVVFSASLVGMAVGSVALGMLADLSVGRESWSVERRCSSSPRSPCRGSRRTSPR